MLGREDIVVVEGNGLEMLHPMGKPAGGKRNREEHGKHVAGEAQCLVDDARIVVNVRVELPG